jgi:hypothetical protein
MFMTFQVAITSSLVGSALFLTTGCDSNRAGELEKLKGTVAGHAASLAMLKYQIENQIEVLADKSVIIDASTPGYTTIETGTGRFLIACDNVQPYLDGQKLTLRIGNPSLLTVSGFKLTATWGTHSPRYPANNPSTEEFAAWIEEYKRWERSLRVKEIDSPTDLKPGVWSNVDVVITPAKPEELAYLKLLMTTNKVSLLKDKPQ